MKPLSCVEGVICGYIDEMWNIPSIGGDFRRWTSAWHAYFKETDPKGYREHQRKAGRARQAQLRRLLGKDGYRQHQRKIAMKRWNGRD